MISPLAPSIYPELPPIDGVTLAVCEAGIRYANRTDLLMAEVAPGTRVAGVFTTSLTASAPVLAGREALKGGTARVLIVNSGNSNAFTGIKGVATVESVRSAACKTIHCAPNEFFMASTGVIGEPMLPDKINAALPGLREKLSPHAWAEAARAIMTTDTYPKMATRTVSMGGVTIRINGIAKGSGMIAPDMATMLAFVFTDANIAAPALQAMLATANATTFNAITVDGDTSTSDTLLLFATGAAGNKEITNASEATEFCAALHDLLLELALHVVKDGEGAEKLIRITVSGAQSDKAAHRIGMSIANSPLVKTALAASDANWGRIVMAVGKSGEAADRDRLSITIGGVIVAKDGMAAPDYQESQIESHMKSRDITIDVDVGVGSGKATVWTCDLTHGYIDINGSYRS